MIILLRVNDYPLTVIKDKFQLFVAIRTFQRELNVNEWVLLICKGHTDASSNYFSYL